MKPETTGQAALRWVNRLGPLLALLLVYGFFAALSPRMLSLGAVEIIVQQSVLVGVAAIGMTFVIIAGGIDLSAGSVIALASVAAAQVLTALGLPPSVALLGAMLAGLLAGLFNGLLITRLGLVPFIATLGSLLMLRGAAKGLSGSMPVNVEPTWLSGLLAALPEGYGWLLVPPGAWLMIVLAVLAALFLHYTPTGRHIFAVGSNEAAARLCGVPVERTKCIVYALSGLFAGLSGLLLVSYQDQGDPTGAMGYELDIIAAVVIGGGSLSGGEGSIFGSLVGAVIMTVIRTGCQLIGLPTWVTQIVTGAVIVAAVAVDRLRHRRRA